MSKKKNNQRIVYSTNPDFLPYDDSIENEVETLLPANKNSSLAWTKSNERVKK